MSPEEIINTDHQFADGSVMAATLASLHNGKDFDPSFNEQVKPAMVGILGLVKQTAGEVCDKTKPEDRTGEYCQELGKEKLLQVLQDNIDRQDWEAAAVGRIGKDVGGAIAAPIGCLVGHMVLNGCCEKSIHDYIYTLLDDYTSKMMKAGKSSEDMALIFRNIIGWCGMIQYVVFYFLGVQLDVFGVKGEELQAYVRDSMGILGLKLMRVAYDDSTIYTLGILKTIFYTLVDEEVALAEKEFASRNNNMVTSSTTTPADDYDNFLDYMFDNNVPDEYVTYTKNM